MTDDHEESRIPLFFLGDMRMVGLKVPKQFEGLPDDNMLTLPRSAALDMATRCLKKWKVPEDELENFCAEIADDVIHDVLVSHQLLLVLLRKPEPDKFFRSPNKNFDDRTPWDLIRNGESERIRKSLEYQVFCGGW